MQNEKDERTERLKALDKTYKEARKIFEDGGAVILSAWGHKEGQRDENFATFGSGDNAHDFRRALIAIFDAMEGVWGMAVSEALDQYIHDGMVYYRGRDWATHRKKAEAVGSMIKNLLLSDGRYFLIAEPLNNHSAPLFMTRGEPFEMVRDMITTASLDNRTMIDILGHLYEVIGQADTKQKTNQTKKFGQ